MLFADTSYLIALFRANDEMHLRAVEIEAEIDERVATTDAVLSEFITYASAKDGNKAAYGIGVKLLRSNLEIIHAGADDFALALENIRKFPKISMCDAISATVMKRMGMKKILSFDSDFDRLDFVRIH